MKTVRYMLNDIVRGGRLEELPAGARLLPPCTPTKIVCVGRNYPEHARELCAFEN